MRSAGGSRLAPDRVFEGIVEFRRCSAPARHGRRGSRRRGRVVRRRRGWRCPAWDAVTGARRATASTRRAADVDAGAHRSSPAAPCRASASAVIRTCFLIILGDDLFFACVRASFGAALALARVRQCVRGEGAATRARAAFLRRGGTRSFASQMGGDQRRFQSKRVYPIDCSEVQLVVLARTRQKVLLGHFESDMTERGSFDTSPAY